MMVLINGRRKIYYGVLRNENCAIQRDNFLYGKGSGGAVVSGLRQGFTDANRRENGRCSVQVEFFNAP